MTKDKVSNGLMKFALFIKRFNFVRNTFHHISIFDLDFKPRLKVFESRSYHVSEILKYSAGYPFPFKIFIRLDF